MELLTESPHPSWPFPFVPQDWEHTPTTVQSYVHSLHDELAKLRERVDAGIHLRRDTIRSQPLSAMI